MHGLQALRAHAAHQRWRDAVHEALVRLRWRNMLRGWRRWARQQRVEAAALQRARRVYERRLLAEAWQHWAWLAHNKASATLDLVGGLATTDGNCCSSLRHQAACSNHWGVLVAHPENATPACRPSCGA